ncbi:MAG: hypothetical protein QW051_03865 [Candidatus Aenigmatarchaeota archaeon]
MKEEVCMSEREVLEILLALARERLTKKQKLVIIRLSQNNLLVTATRFVSIISEEMRCSRSTIWNVINSPKRAKLVKFGSAEQRGKPIRLTEIGKIISDDLEVRI